jgi:hypothetical protein
VDVAAGRKARLQGAPPEGQECVPKPPFHGEREVGFTALSRLSPKSAGSMGCALTPAIWGARVTPSPSEYDGPLWLFQDPMRRWRRPAIWKHEVACHSLWRQFVADQSVTPTTIGADLCAIFISLELSRSTWLATSLSPGRGEKMSKHSVAAPPAAPTIEVLFAPNETLDSHSPAY